MLDEEVVLLHNKNIVLRESISSSGIFRRQFPFPINQKLDLVPSIGGPLREFIYVKKTSWPAWKNW